MNIGKEEVTGNPSLAGWIYQCEVSVWAALELMLVQRLAAVVQLEPASQEDIEAEVDAPRAASRIATSSALLVIQAKLRRSGQWTPALLKAMVEHGTRRLSAIKRLEAADVRYVLVTSADVNSQLQPLMVQDFIEEPETSNLPVEVFGVTLAKDAAKRFSILGLHTEQRIGERIERILMSSLSVPQPFLDSCRKRLREEAMMRMSQGSAWLREELEVVIRASGGAIPSDVTDAYVEPSCWNEIVHQMDNKHAVVLVGPSGTGKTTTAWTLAKYLKSRFGGLDVVLADSPAAIRSCRNEGPTLFYLDDPWGKYQITKDRHPWAIELPGFLHQASAHRMFIVTTRSDIFKEAVGSSETFSRWELQLGSQSYGASQRIQLYKNRLAQLPNGTLKTAALDARDRVLDVLDTPFEIDRFFKHVQSGVDKGDTSEAMFVARVLTSTQRDAIEVEVKQLVATRASEHWAAVLWALLAAHGGVDRAELPDIRRKLAHRDSTFKSGLDTLLDALVAGGSLRQLGSKVRYAHPRVELGLMAAMLAQSEIVEDALGTLLLVLVDLDKSGVGRGGEAATRVYARMLQDTPWHFIAPEVQAAIDRWLEHALGTTDADYPALLQLAASTGSDKSLPAEVARWLTMEATKRYRRSLHEWEEPACSEQWYARIGTHACTRHICMQFITRVLPFSSVNYTEVMADSLHKWACGLGDAWRQAALDMVDNPDLRNGQSIAYGAMLYRENRAELLETALGVLRSRAPAKYTEAEMWAIEDGYFDEDEQEDYDYHVPGEAAMQICLAYVARVRAEGDWRGLATSGLLAELPQYWAAAISWTGAVEACKEELISLFDCALELRDERTAWRVAQRFWLPEFESRLRSSLRTGHLTDPAHREVVQCALVAASDVLNDEIAFQLKQREKKRLCELLFEISHARLFGELSDLRREHDRFVAALPEPCKELSDVFAAEMVSDVSLSDEALAIAAQAIVECTGYLQALLLRAAAARGPVPVGLINDILGSGEPETAILGLRVAKEAGLCGLVENAIAHSRADVRCLAFEFMVEKNGGEVAPQWLSLASDKSGRVRKALALALEACPLDDAQAELVRLCGDQWISQPDTWRHDVFPVARAAARALGGVTSIGDVDAAQLLDLARRTNDPDIQSHIHAALARKASDDTRAVLARAAFDGETKLLRVSAMRALACAGENVAEEILASLTSAWLSTCDPELAAWGAATIGRCAALPRVEETCGQLARLPTRRVLLVAVAFGLQERDPALSQRALEWLPARHSARSLFAGGKCLPSEVLDDLGDIEVVNVVLTFCADLVEVRAKVASVSRANG
ncbi:MAG TPA: hypothetical protein VN089_27650 [Duganella sp.]|nr:hypothetical protein [Duganella sp.]